MAIVKFLYRISMSVAAGACLFFAGCEGDDGAQGPPGPAGGTTIDVVADPPTELNVEITGVTISSPPVVNFTAQDGNGKGATGLTAGSSGRVRVGIAKLVPGTGGDTSQWKSYVNRDSDGVTQATTERTGTLVDHGDGTYTYTFAADITAATDPVTADPIPYEPTLTHRVAIQISGGGLPATNETHDWVPAGGAVTTREIAMTSSCNECHGTLTLHGSRYELKYCVTCHNPGTTDSESGSTADMAVMTHKIHASSMLSEPYELAGNDYSEVTYPQDLRNCRKCHSGDDEATPDGWNWKNKPTAIACSSCHDDIVFTEPVPEGKVLHSGGVFTDNELCSSCHTATNIEIYHRTENVTPNNPDLPAGLSAMEYELLSVTVDEGRHPVIEFRINRDGEPLDLLDLPEDLTGSPAFLLSYAMAQDGIDEPADYNNLGRSAAQPQSVTISDVASGSAGTLVAGDDGAFTATLTATFPDGATLRSISIQAYYSQTVPVVGGGTESIGRHTYSVVMAAEGDEERRSVVDTDKCLKCHEIFEGHGGNRVSNVQVCVTCHNTNLSSSGRTVASPNETIIDQLGDDPLTYPEDTNNFKDMIHGIHASGVRTTDYEFVRNRSDGLYYNWSEVTFPNDVGDCQVCHFEDTYVVPVTASALVTTNRTTTGDPDEDIDDITSARTDVPNDTDLVTTPMAAACVMCHDGTSSKNHMEQNGAAIQTARSTVLAAINGEACSVCHGSGRSADVDVAHGQE